MRYEVRGGPKKYHNALYFLLPEPHASHLEPVKLAI
jgi:hypothetical protein